MAKYRLFVVIDKVQNKAWYPYKFSLLLGDKKEVDTKSAVCFRLTNAETVFNRADKMGHVAWQVDVSLVNPLETANVCTRVLVAKICQKKTLRDIQDVICRVLQKVEVPQTYAHGRPVDAIWVWNVLFELSDLGSPFDTIPKFFGGGASVLELAVIEAAEEGTKLKEKATPGASSAYYHLDIRGRRDAIPGPEEHKSAMELYQYLDYFS